MLNFFKKNKTKGEVPTIARKYGIRTSSPHGLFPQDVESTLEALEKERNQLRELLEKTREENEKHLKDIEDLKAVITELKMDMSLIEIPDTTSAQDFKNINKIKSLKNKKVEVQNETDFEVVEI